jgi:dienelactone hydrolase
MLLLAISLAAQLHFGPHAVGFRRIGDVSVWYPAQRSGTPMKLGDYYGASLKPFGLFLASTGLSSEAINALFDAPMSARRDATPLKRAFPLVLVAQGNHQDAPDQAVLTEFLASHGFIVASTPSPMIRTPMRSEDEIGTFAARQAKDLARAIDVASASLRVAPGPIAVVGHSFGARSALLLALQNRRVTKLVSLDGGIGTATGAAGLEAVDLARAPAILHLYEDLDPFMTPDFAFLDTLRARKELIPGVHHAHFTTMGFAAAAMPELAKITHAGGEIGESVGKIAQRTLEFLRK